MALSWFWIKGALALNTPPDWLLLGDTRVSHPESLAPLLQHF